MAYWMAFGNIWTFFVSIVSRAANVPTLRSPSFCGVVAAWSTVRKHACGTEHQLCTCAIISQHSHFNTQHTTQRRACDTDRTTPPNAPDSDVTFRISPYPCVSFFSSFLLLAHSLFLSLSLSSTNVRRFYDAVSVPQHSSRLRIQVQVRSGLGHKVRPIALVCWAETYCFSYGCISAVPNTNRNVSGSATCWRTQTLCSSWPSSIVSHSLLSQVCLPPSLSLLSPPLSLLPISLSFFFSFFLNCAYSR